MASVYTNREHVCMDVFGRVHGAYTAPYTGRVHGHVRAVHTTVYTTRIRPRTHVYVYKGRVHGRVRAIYTAENDGRTRLCDVSCIRPCTRGRIGSCTRQCTGRVHGRFRSCTLAVYTAVFGHLHSAYTARVLDRYTAVYKARVWAVYTAGRPSGRVHVPRRHATAVCGPCCLGLCTRPCRPTCHVHDCVLAVYTDVYMARTRPFNCSVVHGRKHYRERAMYTAVTGRTRP